MDSLHEINNTEKILVFQGTQINDFNLFDKDKVNLGFNLKHF